MLRTHKSDLELSQKLGVPIPQKVYDRQFSEKSVSNINYIISLTRGEEIREWLDSNEVSDYVVIDYQVKDILSWVDKSRVVE